MVLDAKSSQDDAFTLVTGYAPPGAGQPAFLRLMEVFLGTSYSLFLVGDWIAILHACQDRVGLIDRRGVTKSIKSRFQLATGTDWTLLMCLHGHG